MTCNLCNEIVLNKRGSNAHINLEKQKIVKKPVIGQSVFSTTYRCKDCGQGWEYEDDKNDLNAGWSKAVL
jgi:hypothetical protein